MGNNNKILNAANDPIVVTTLLANNSVSTLDGVPLGTVGDTTTGELVLKVSVRETAPPPPATGGEFTSSPALVTSSGSIPAQCLGWSFTVVSGTVTLNGSGTLPIGASFSGGGYTGYVLASAISYTIAAGSALVQVDNPQS
jgi:hypothetical protein